MWFNTEHYSFEQTIRRHCICNIVSAHSTPPTILSSHVPTSGTAVYWSVWRRFVCTNTNIVRFSLLGMPIHAFVLLFRSSFVGTSMQVCRSCHYPQTYKSPCVCVCVCFWASPWSGFVRLRSSLARLKLALASPLYTHCSIYSSRSRWYLQNLASSPASCFVPHFIFMQMASLASFQRVVNFFTT